MIPRHVLILLGCTILASNLIAADVAGDVYHVGLATTDITPTHPIRLNGFGFRRTESEGVNHPIHARAISIRHKDDSEPTVLVTVDVLGIPATIRAELVKRLKGTVASERLAITATHTHCGPMLTGANPTLFGVPIPAEHQKRIDEYTAVFMDKLEATIRQSLQGTKPSMLSWGVGSVGFAKNRRTVGGPTDHDLPILVVRDAGTGQVRAVHVSYACHCVTLSHNRLGGDWAGYAAEAIQNQFPGATALVAIGCGADQNPDSGVTGDKVEMAQVQGRQIADAVKRLVAGYLAPVSGKPHCQWHALTLPLAAHPDRAGWEEKAKRTDAIGHHARVQLAKLDRNESLATSIDYPVQTWAFGESLAFVHLPGEVVVDYAVRLKKQHSRIWITAYANTNPCYIPSERILKEGGYEGGGAMVYYDVPTPFQPGLEAKIVAEVKRQLGNAFDSTIDRSKMQGGPLSPQQSRQAIQTDAKFVVDLVAAEPLTADPVAMAFGADGKLWLAEMIDYPTGRTGNFEPGGRIRFLEDSNADGIFDRATTFLDGLPFPTGVLPWRNGVLITAAPDILFAEDTTGSGKADRITKLFSGFGTDNFQARVNGLAYGLDGWVYGSCGLFGGQIVSHKLGKTIPLGHRDFRMNPETGAIEPATGRTQQGRVRNDWGDWFGCDNSNLIWHYVLADEHLRRNPFVAPPNPIVHVPAGPDPNKLYPARIPQLYQLSGPAGRTTGACGIAIYRDDRLGTEFTGNAFTCEPVNLLVTRRVLQPKGPTFVGERASNESTREFLASTDPWFRPVQAATGPDGAIWIADMYRHVIEHPRWIPPADLAQLDVRAGAGMGRIYRVRRSDAPAGTWPRLDRFNAAGLVQALETSNGWQRDMATELLAWRNEPAAIPHLQKLARESQLPLARLHALAALDRLGGLDARAVRAALDDDHPGVRRHAVRWSERFINTESMIAEAVRNRVADPDPKVRMQVAAVLGSWHDAKAGEHLAALVGKYGNDPYLLAIVVSSLNRENFRGFIERPEVARLAGTPLLPKLLATAIGLNDQQVLNSLLKIVTTKEGGTYAAWQFLALESMLDAWQRTSMGKPLPQDVAVMLASARELAQDASADLRLRTTALRLLGREPGERTADIERMARLLGPQTPVSLQESAVAALARTGDDRAADALVRAWGGYSPTVQNAVVNVLLNRESWTPKVLAAIRANAIPASVIPPGPRQALLTHPDRTLRSQAEAAFAGAANTNRQQVIESYRAQLPAHGDREQGRKVFAKTCAACHHLNGVGHAIGPDLAALANKSSAYLLVEILDPNRNLDTRYLEYTVQTNDGRTLSGLLASETSAAIVLRHADGKVTTLLRTDLESMKSTGRSLMPEGLEKDLPPASLANLIAYLGSINAPPKQLPGNKPTVVKSLANRLVLRATTAEIHGEQITFETEYQNIGYWHGPRDHVIWSIEAERDDDYDVYFDAACDPSAAGNPFALDTGDTTIRGTIPSTGAWSNYRWSKVGTLKLRTGLQRITIRPDTDALRGALVDLRTVVLVPKGTVPEFLTDRTDPKSQLEPAALAKALLDDATPSAEREALLAANPGKAGPTITAMVAGLSNAKEEYRRIPWIWRVAIAAGKRNQSDELRALLDASLPKPDEPLRDWQAVVIGGGIINGLGLEHGWPAPRIAEIIGQDRKIAERWSAALAASARMADDAKVPNGTRYDALRMVALRGGDVAMQQLLKYLAKGTNDELQMGAVSGLVDIDSPQSTQALIQALGDLAGTNRNLALIGLVRSDSRASALLSEIEAGRVKAVSLPENVTTALRTSKTESIRTRAEKLWPKNSK